MLYFSIYFNIRTNYDELKIDWNTSNIEGILNAPEHSFSRTFFENMAFVLRSDPKHQIPENFACYSSDNVSSRKHGSPRAKSRIVGYIRNRWLIHDWYNSLFSQVRFFLIDSQRFLS